MKRIICMLLALLLLCGCKAVDTVSQNDVVIIFPTDNTVNGYRTESIVSTMPDTLPADEVKPAKPDNNNSTSYTYIGNSNSKVFHSKGCSSVKDMKEENKTYFKTRDEATQKNYSPCGRCKP